MGEDSVLVDWLSQDSPPPPHPGPAAPEAVMDSYHVNSLVYFASITAGAWSLGRDAWEQQEDEGGGQGRQCMRGKNTEIRRW